MRLIENYALNCGLKIHKPYIHPHFFPVSNDNYITLDLSHRVESSRYKHWQKVVDLINPFLKSENIEIIQVGGANDLPIPEAKRTNNGASINQISYLIKSSKLFIGNNNFSFECASANQIPTVCVQDHGKYGKFSWSSFDKFIYPKNNEVIDTVPPEDVANQILNKLNINKKLNFKTVHMGFKYVDGQEFVESIPDQAVSLKSLSINSIIYRMDLKHDEEKLEEQLQQGPISLVTDKEIDLNLLARYKNNILETVYIIKKDNDNFAFCERLKKLGIKLLLVSSLMNEDLNEKKLIYMEVGNIIPQVEERDLKKVKELRKNKDLFYRTCKFTLSNGNVFFSEEDWKLGSFSPEKTAFQRLSSLDKFEHNLDSSWIIKKV